MPTSNPPEEPLELFYSYAHADEALRKELEKHLRLLQQRGLITGWHDRKIPAGAPWADEIDTHLNTAQIILLLISADFLASQYCYGVEMKRALERQEAGEARVIPIILRPVDWEHEPSLHKLQALPTGAIAVTDWPMSPTYDNAFKDIARGIRLVVEEYHKSSPTKSSKTAQGWNIPYRRNPFFTGREQLLKQLHDNLSSARVAALTQAQAISGLGGIGKTQTAVEYAYRYRDEYRYILWVSAAASDLLITGFVELATVLNLPEREEQDQNRIVAAVKLWLEQHGQWLLILDNADDFALIEDFLPVDSQGHILITTRAQAAGNLANSIAVEKMDQQEGTLLLLRRAKVLAIDVLLEKAPVQDRAKAEEIVKEMGGLPLALDQAGAYIEETKCSLAAYLERYRQRQTTLLQRRGGIGKEHPEPVARTWSLSFEQVEKLNPAAADLLRCCAFLSPDAIPEELILEGASQLGANLQPIGGDPALFDEAIGILLHFSLVHRNREDTTLSIHRLVQTVLKASMTKKAQRVWARRTIKTVEYVFPVVEFAIWLQCKRLIAHAQVCAELASQYTLTFPEVVQLLNQAGQYLYARGLYKEAEPLFQQALAIREQELGPSHPDIAQSLNNLAALYYSQGRYDEAVSLYLRALAIKEQELGPSHPDTALGLNNLAALYYSQSKYDKAESLYLRALAIREKELRPSHPDTAQSLNNLAELYRTQGKFVEAEPLFQRTLAIFEKELGPSHPSTATSLNNLAELYRTQGKYDKAESLYLRALAIREQELGPSHPDTALGLNNLAALYDSQGKYDKAEPLYLRALAIWEKELGSSHPETARGLNNLALLYDSQGKYAEAEPLYQRALAIKEQELGPSHPSTATSLNNLAMLYDNQGKFVEAEPLYQRALAIFEQVLGHDHLSTMTVRANYDGLLERMKQK
jgi:tetratricopeptide (TPR) repeat protein